jgi:hypothetical protein
MFTEKIKVMGPLERNESLLRCIQAAELTLQKKKIRWLMGIELNLLEKGNVWGEKVSSSHFESVMTASLQDEYIKSRIVLSVKGNPMSVKEIDMTTKFGIETISSYLTELEELGEISLYTFEGRTPKYIS